MLLTICRMLHTCSSALLTGLPLLCAPLLLLSSLPSPPSPTPPSADVVGLAISDSMAARPSTAGNSLALICTASRLSLTRWHSNGGDPLLSTISVTSDPGTSLPLTMWRPSGCRKASPSTVTMLSPTCRPAKSAGLPATQCVTLPPAVPLASSLTRSPVLVRGLFGGVVPLLPLPLPTLEPTTTSDMRCMSLLVESSLGASDESTPATGPTAPPAAAACFSMTASKLTLSCATLLSPKLLLSVGDVVVADLTESGLPALLLGFAPAGLSVPAADAASIAPLLPFLANDRQSHSQRRQAARLVRFQIFRISESRKGLASSLLLKPKI